MKKQIKSRNNFNIRVCFSVILLIIMLTQVTLVYADETNTSNNQANGVNQVAADNQATAENQVTKAVVVKKEDAQGIQIDNNYYSVYTGRFINSNQNRDNYYDDGEGNTFAVYIQPTTDINKNSMNIYYEDVYSESMLKAASQSIINEIINQQVEGQFFNGIDESRIIEVTNTDGNTYPALFWKYSVKFNNSNYFFYTYEIIDKNIMYNLTFSATSYNFLESSDINSIISSFKIKNYQEFEHKPNNGNLVSSAIHSKSLSKVIGICAAVVVLVIISLIIKMKRVNKEEIEMIHEKEKELGINPNQSKKE